MAQAVAPPSLKAISMSLSFARWITDSMSRAKPPREGLVITLLANRRPTTLDVLRGRTSRLVTSLHCWSETAEN